MDRLAVLGFGNAVACGSAGEAALEKVLLFWNAAGIASHLIGLVVVRLTLT